MRKIKIEFEAPYWSDSLREEFMQYIIHSCSDYGFRPRGIIKEIDKDKEEEFVIKWN